MDENKKVQIFSTSDDRLKILGEIFSNKSSRNILLSILEKEMTIMQISQETGISANLIMHHLKKMTSSNIVTVTRQSKNSRGHILRFYRAKPAIVILANDTANLASHSKSFRKVLEKITRFSAVGIAGAFAWMMSNASQLEAALKYPRPTLPPYLMPIEPQTSQEFLLATLVTTSVIVCGLLINHYVPKILHRK